MFLVGSRDVFTMPLQLCLYFLKGDTAVIPLITPVKYCLQLCNYVALMCILKNFLYKSTFEHKTTKSTHKQKVKSGEKTEIDEFL